ncbi:uncharacterized protein IUM83_08209 [Phytophthora cinnamomi]|uniref:uncharacterized protein n=1 Tax=Phytophthora cinnamomi TaxID=4785 RepID=UPI00355A00D4|nr:hypothetical protein IUM83_08209 [Phytophthora cinnamomi]
MDGRSAASFLEDDALADAWRFLLPWCDHVRGAISYSEGESSDPPFQAYHGLKIAKTPSPMGKTTWRKLLMQSAVLARRFTASEKFDALSARFLLELLYGSGSLRTTSTA